MRQFHLKWLDLGRRPQSPPDPTYPGGTDIVMPRGPTDSRRDCSARLPYPPPNANIGQWLVTCRRCGFKLMLTAASRPDDPRSVTFPCQKHKQKAKGRMLQ